MTGHKATVQEYLLSRVAKHQMLCIGARKFIHHAQLSHTKKLRFELNFWQERIFNVSTSIIPCMFQTHHFIISVNIHFSERNATNSSLEHLNVQPWFPINQRWIRCWDSTALYRHSTDVFTVRNNHKSYSFTDIQKRLKKAKPPTPPMHYCCGSKVLKLDACISCMCVCVWNDAVDNLLVHASRDVT